jgi:CheY-like chemotaxis protein
VRAVPAVRAAGGGLHRDRGHRPWAHACAARASHGRSRRHRAQRPGEGSTFFLELPLRSSAAPVGRQRPLCTAARTWDVGAARILYVEDNLSNLELVESILSRSPGLELIPAMQGSLALELATRHDPDVVLLDLDLPDIAGEEVLRLLRADSRTSAIPVIVLSADATPAQLARMQNEGIVAYLTKPLNIGLFLDTLRAALAHTASS